MNAFSNGDSMFKLVAQGPHDIGYPYLPRAGARAPVTARAVPDERVVRRYFLAEEKPLEHLLGVCIARKIIDRADRRADLAAEAHGKILPPVIGQFYVRDQSSASFNSSSRKVTYGICSSKLRPGHVGEHALQPLRYALEILREGYPLGARLFAGAAPDACLRHMVHPDKVEKFLAPRHLGRAGAEYLVEERVAFRQIFVAVENTIDAITDRAHVPAVHAHDALGEVFR